MSVDDTPDGGSPSDLRAFLRRLRAAQPASDPVAQHHATIAQDARLAPTGGLFGSGYAQYMANNRATSPAGAAGGPVQGTWDGGATPLDDAVARAADLHIAPMAASVQTPPPAGALATLATSPRGRAFIQSFETNPATRQPYEKVYDDGYGNPTFGYGHRIGSAEHAALQAKIAGLDQDGRAALIDHMFEQDLAAAEQRVKDKVGLDALKTLTQAQFDALVADSFNAGSVGALGPKMLQNIWDGDMSGAARQFDAITGLNQHTQRREIVHGLTRRNLAEGAMFDRGDYTYQPSQREMDALEAAKRAELAAKAGQPPPSRGQRRP